MTPARAAHGHAVQRMTPSVLAELRRFVDALREFLGLDPLTPERVA